MVYCEGNIYRETSQLFGNSEFFFAQLKLLEEPEIRHSIPSRFHLDNPVLISKVLPSIIYFDRKKSSTESGAVSKESFYINEIIQGSELDLRLYPGAEDQNIESILTNLALINNRELAKQAYKGILKQIFDFYNKKSRMEN